MLRSAVVGNPAIQHDVQARDWRNLQVKPILKVWLGTALLAGGSLVLHAADVRTDYDKHADFSRYHSYCWGQVSTDDPLYQNRIKEEVSKDLESKGWQEGNRGSCDVTVFAKGNVRNQRELRTYYNGLGGGWGGMWGWGGWAWPGGWWGPDMGETTTTEVNHPVGSLVIDIFDNQSKELVWRGISHGDVSKHAEKNTKHIDKDIDQMFGHFPPRK